MPLGTHKATLFGVAGVSTGGDVVLLSSQTASDSSSLDFTSGIDSTYGEYIFKFYNINPATDGTHFEVQASTDGGSSYGLTKTTAWFYAIHNENDSFTVLSYATSVDLAQSTDPQSIAYQIGNGADESAAGILHLFSPSSTTYVKHFYSRMNVYRSDNYQQDTFSAGYFNDTNDIDAIQFKMSSGNISSGVIKMWGVK